MTEFLQQTSLIDSVKNMDKTVEGIDGRLIQLIHDNGFTIFEVDSTRPWGGFIRLSSDQADRFVNDAFPGLTPSEARLGIEGAELAPKIIWVQEEQRLSLQTHERRAERWLFITNGAYVKGSSEEDLQLINATAGDVVQFGAGDIHRLCGNSSGNGVVLVAEIWQHIDSNKLSDEDDIIRLQDDYSR